MRPLFWFVALFALAAGLVLAARYNTGYVLLVLPPYRIELSINLLLLLLVGGFVVLFGLVRFAQTALNLPARVRAYRAGRRHEEAQSNLIEALREFFAGRYARAEKAAQHCITLGEHAGLGAVLAARAAHELRAFDRRDAYLARAESLSGSDDVVTIIAQAEMLLDERRAAEALDALKRLPQQHTAALRLELKAQQYGRNWDRVLALVDMLERRGVFQGEQAEQLRRHALSESLKRKALDARSLDEAWKRVPDERRRDPRIAAAAAQCYIALGAGAAARTVIEQALDAEWDSELVTLYAECSEPDGVRQIEKAENWLKREPHDAPLLLTLGRLCMQQELWGKAESYLEASLSIDPTFTAHLELAGLHERMGNAEAARRHYRASLDLAVKRLRVQGGGRRDN